ncbi:MAG: BatA domain-containing protein, partial [Candidatus Omnitrophica bacterium]|nr:BatA domain-containing protein [Candidatus Omnitrophota bacterium]
MTFEDPSNFLWMVLFIPGVLYVYFKVHPHGQLRFSSIKNLKRLQPSFSLKLRHGLIILRILAISLLTLGLMRPQKGIEETKIETEGIDIVL